MKFRFPWTVDVVIAVIAVYFFLAGLADGSVSSFNIALWAFILLGLAVVVGGSLWLRKAGRTGIAAALAWVLVGPGVLAGLLLLLVLISNPRWN